MTDVLAIENCIADMAAPGLGQDMPGESPRHAPEVRMPQTRRSPRDVFARRTIVVAGPPRDRIGGMSTVFAQMMKADLDGEFECVEFALSLRGAAGEGILHRGIRHLTQLRRFGRTIANHSTLAVHLHTCSGFSFLHSTALASAARRRGAKVILHIHGAAFDRFYDRGGLLRRRFIRRTLHRADCVVVLSEGWRRIIAAMAPDARMEVIENAVDVGPWRDRAREQATCRLLLLASMDEWKGIDDLLDACAIAVSRGALLDVVLAGPEGSAGNAEVLTNKITRRGLADCVRYIGSAGPKSKANWLDWADVYVQPSRHEGMPLAVLEAMAAGLPVIATQAGAMPEVVTHNVTGLIVPVNDVEALAGAIVQLAGDRAMRCHFGRAGYDQASKRFSSERFTHDLKRLYLSLVEDTRTQPLVGSRSSADLRPLRR